MTESNRNIPKAKQTVLGLYVTAAEAYEMLNADPENVVVIDVRTPEEYIFVGHAEQSWNIPLAFVKYQWDSERGVPELKPNKEFIARVKSLFPPERKLLVTCRSGDRSAAAVNALAKAGYTNAYTVTDGIEGDLVKDPESVFFGQRMMNGWKNSAPWTYKVDPKLLWIEQ